MRLLPRSLFARMVLILLVGLCLAQLLSLAVHWRERGEFAQRAMGMRSGERIADIVRLLDTTAPADRARIVSVLNSPPLRISLDAPALAPTSAAGDKAEFAAQFAAGLRRLLGDDRPLSVQVLDAPAWGPMAPGMKGPGYGKMTGRAATRADVQAWRSWCRRGSSTARSSRSIRASPPRRWAGRGVSW
jgi:hypothetical protein